MFVMGGVHEAVRRLVEMVVGTNLVLVGDLSQQFHILDIVSADIDVKKC